jgi:hypothetical protein
MYTGWGRDADGAHTFSGVCGQIDRDKAVDSDRDGPEETGRALPHTVA